MNKKLSQARAFDGILRGTAILIAGLFFHHGMVTDSLISPVYPVISNALFISVAAFLLLPLSANPLIALINGSLACLLFLLLHLLTFENTIPAQLVFQAAMTTLCLSLLLFSLAQWQSRRVADHVGVRLWLLVLMMLIASSPVWLGPLVELSQPGEPLINTIIALSPVTHFSVALEYDFLRSEWMYRNTSLGSLPFSYPDFVLILCGYLATVILIQILLYRYPRPTRRSAPPQDSISVP